MGKKTFINTATGEQNEDLYDLGVRIPRRGAVKGVVSDMEYAIPDVLKNDPNLNQSRQDFYSDYQQLLRDPGHALTNYSPGPVEFVGNTGVGISSYDEDITSRSQLEDLSETRAQLQPWYDQVGGSIAKGVVTAGTTFLDSTIGLVVAGVSAPQNGFSAFAGNNAFSQSMAEIQEWSKEAIPFYETNEQKANQGAGEWYKNLLEPTYVFNQVADQLGFVAGAVASGQVYGGAINALSKSGVVRNLFTGLANTEKSAPILQEVLAGGKAVNAAEVAATAASNANKVMASGLTKGIVGATMGSQGEARFEAINNTKDWKTYQNQNIDVAEAAYVKQLTDAVLASSELSQEVYDQNGNLIGYEKVLPLGVKTMIEQQAENKFRDTRAKVEQEAITMGNNIFLSNMAVLSLSNFAQFGKLIGGGYKTTTKAAANYINPIKNATGELTGTSVKTGLLKPTIKAGVKNMLTEGNEEMMQQSVATGMGLQAAANLNSFHGAKIDPEATAEMTNWLNAMQEGVAQTYTDPKQYEQFFYGAVMGAMGLPMVKRSGGKWKVEMGGGFAEGRKEAKENIAEANDLSATINTALNNNNFQSYLDGLVRDGHYNAKKEKAIFDESEFDFKNAEHGALVNAAITFDKAGRIEDLYRMINSAATVTDEDIPTLKQQGAKKDGTNIYDGKTDAEIKEFVKKQATETKQAVDNYRKLADSLTVQLGKDFKGDARDEMVYTLSNIDNLENRFSSIIEETKKTLADSGLTHLKYTDETGVEKSVTDVLNNSPAEILNAMSLLDADLKSVHKKQVDKYNQKVDKIQNKAAIGDMRGAHNIVKALETLKETIATNPVMSAKYQDTYKQLEDLSKIFDYRAEMLIKYNKYLNNPALLNEQIQKEEVVADVELKGKEAADHKTKLEGAATYEEYKTALHKVDTTEVATAQEDLVNELAESGHAFSQQYKKQKGTRDSVIADINKKEPTEASELAKKIVYRTFKHADETVDIADINNLSYNQEIEIDDAGMPIDPLTVAQAKNIVNQSINNVLESRAKQAKEAEEFAENPEGAVVSSTPAVPVGVVTEDEVITDNKNNKDTLTSQENTKKQTQEVGKIKYWKPEISEYPIAAKNEGDFTQLTSEAIPVLKPIYTFLVNKGAFVYANNANIKQGDKVVFIVREDVNTLVGSKFSPILIAVENKEATNEADKYQIIGLLEESGSDKYFGMNALRQRILENYAALKTPAEKTNYVHTETTTVDEIEPGRILFTKTEQEFKAIDGVLTTEGKTSAKVKFAVIKNNQFEIPNLQRQQALQPRELVNGRLYLLIKGGDGRYQPAMVRTKRFNAAFDAENMPVINKRITDLFKDLLAGKPIVGVNGGIKGALGNVLFFNEDELFIERTSDDKNSYIKFTYKPQGGEAITKLVTVGNTVEAESDIPGLDFDLTTTSETLPEELVLPELMLALQSFDLHYQVSANKLNDPTYNDYLVQSNILTVNTDRLNTVASYPFINPIGEDGVAIKSELPARPEVVTKVEATNPVNTSELKTTNVTHNGVAYYVDLNTEYIYENKKDVGLVKVDKINGQERTIILTKAEVKKNWSDKVWRDTHVVGDAKTGLVLIWDVLGTENVLDLATSELVTDIATLKQFNKELAAQTKPQETVAPKKSAISRLGSSKLKPSNTETLTNINTIDADKLSKITIFAELPQSVKDALAKIDIDQSDWEMYTEADRKNELECLGF